MYDTRTILTKNNLLLSGFWKVETKNRFCPNTLNNGINGTQDECQNLCKNNASCAGISYSRKLDTAQVNCHICRDDQLNPSTDGFDFYKLGGIQ